ncbi:hypothetical protein [Georgenia sp. SYP-B2076]|uniref:hypothetical protein n=1 Tax=Georgenia sp. SYP-B2076 TaxID=2495881 RepID=UPI0013DEF7F0|nr:hypothetical protein [Georgenia sp. SYP-B2076]
MWLWLFGLVLLVLVVVGLWAGKKRGNRRDGDAQAPEVLPDPRHYYFGSGSNTGPF